MNIDYQLFAGGNGGVVVIPATAHDDASVVGAPVVHEYACQSFSLRAPQQCTLSPSTGEAPRPQVTSCTGGLPIWQASSVQQSNAVPITSGVHVGRNGGAVIAQLNCVDKCKSRWRMITSEVGLLLAFVL